MKKIAFIIAIALIAVGLAQTATADTNDTQYAQFLRSLVFVDTNATTTVTLYTATAKGQELHGFVASSNAIWKAAATGTNAWVKIAQETIVE